MHNKNKQSRESANLHRLLHHKPAYYRRFIERLLCDCGFNRLTVSGDELYSAKLR